MKRFNQNEITEKIKANPRSIRHILKNYDLSKYKNISQNNNEIAYLIVNNLENIPKCKCGYNLKFHKYSKGYAETCGKNECVNLLIKSKREQTCLQKYGTKSVFESDIFKNKIKQTNLEKYGVEHPSQTQEFQDKIKQTNLEKYGVEHVSQTDKWKDKVKQTKKSPPYSLKYFKNKINDDNIEILSEMDNNLKINCHNCNSNRSINKSTINFRIRNKQIICTKCNPIFKNQSNGELELYKFIKDNYNGIIIQNYKINGNEIDIYLPELKLGFEYNGVYYHSEKFLDKKKHYNKSMFFNEIDINLIHIWSDDWHNKKDIVKDIIKSKFNSKRIGARQCKLKIVEKQIATEFHKQHHLDGYASSSIHIGLYFNDKLISVASFGIPRFNKHIDLELVRYTVAFNYLIMGGFAKMFKYVLNNYEFTTIQTFKKIDMGTSNIYENLGFVKLKDVFSYYYNINGIRKHRWNFTKKKLGIQGKKITEREYMQSKGFYRVWDSGSNVFVYTKKNI